MVLYDCMVISAPTTYFCVEGFHDYEGSLPVLVDPGNKDTIRALFRYHMRSLNYEALFFELVSSAELQCLEYDYIRSQRAVCSIGYTIDMI